MIKFAIGAAVAVLVVSSFAKAEQPTLTGDAAQKMFFELQQDSSSTLIMNDTTCTILQRNDTVCRLFGNHSESEQMAGGPQWSCGTSEDLKVCEP